MIFKQNSSSYEATSKKSDIQYTHYKMKGISFVFDTFTFHLDTVTIKQTFSV